MGEVDNTKRCFVFVSDDFDFFRQEKRFIRLYRDMLDILLENRVCCYKPYFRDLFAVWCKNWACEFIEPKLFALLLSDDDIDDVVDDDGDDDY